MNTTEITSTKLSAMPLKEFKATVAVGEFSITLDKDHVCSIVKTADEIKGMKTMTYTEFKRTDKKLLRQRLKKGTWKLLKVTANRDEKTVCYAKK